MRFDTAVNAGDVSCTTLLIFGGNCSGGSRHQVQGDPSLMIDGSTRLTPDKPLWLPVRFQSRGHGISTLAFSLDLDLRHLRFDPSDRDHDGIPDAVRFPAGMPSLADVHFDARDRDGELDVLLSDLDGAALADGVVLEIRLDAAQRSLLARSVSFSTAPRASFGSVTGDSVPGRAIVIQRR